MKLRAGCPSSNMREKIKGSEREREREGGEEEGSWQLIPADRNETRRERKWLVIVGITRLTKRLSRHFIVLFPSRLTSETGPCRC